MNYPDSVKARFWKKVSKDGDIPKQWPNCGPCWLWTGAVNEHGYGDFRTVGRHDKAHRVSWRINVGDIPSGVCVLHHCDNPPCIKPDHLFLGTMADNVQDMKSKNRHRNKTFKGELNGFAKLTWKTVRKIRKLYKSGNYTMTALGRLFGSSRPNVANIVYNKYWVE